MIYYFCPDLTVKSAGIRILYRHVELLTRHGLPAAILHQHPGFRVDDMPPAPVRALASPGTLNAGDIVVIPEGYPQLMRLLKGAPLRRVGIALNWQYVYGSLIRCQEESQIELANTSAMPGEPAAVYRDWRDFGIERIITHSPLIADFLSWSMGLPCHVVGWGICPERYEFEPGSKTASVIYIERKQTQVAEFKAVLASRDPRFVTEIRWQGLEGLSEEDYARQVRSASVFLNMSPAEGLPCSLLEAMRAGTLVAGYDSVGGQDDLIGEGPEQNCLRAPNSDYPALARLLEPVLRDILAGDLGPWAGILHNAQQTSFRYTPEVEEATVLALWQELLAPNSAAA